jgi:type IV secretory pathway TrbD component
VDRQVTVVKTTCTAVLGLGLTTHHTVVLTIVVVVDAIQTQIRSDVMVMGIVFRRKLRLKGKKRDCWST